jgi:adenylate cyclase class 2
MAAIETEIKFRVADTVKLEAQLSSIGFHLVTPRSFESNVLYDTSDRSLRAKRELVRIRQYDGRWLLTHKRVPDSGIGEDRHKHRVETETELSDGQALAEVFASIGFVPVFRYEKWRTEWADDTGHCVVDETPIGVFAELEGPAEWIDDISLQLGIAPHQQMTVSYGRLFEQWREQTGSTAQDLTFEALAEVAP